MLRASTEAHPSLAPASAVGGTRPRSGSEARLSRSRPTHALRRARPARDVTAPPRPLGAAGAAAARARLLPHAVAPAFAPPKLPNVNTLSTLAPGAGLRGQRNSAFFRRRGTSIEITANPRSSEDEDAQWLAWPAPLHQRRRRALRAARCGHAGVGRPPVRLASTARSWGPGRDDGSERWRGRCLAGRSGLARRLAAPGRDSACARPQGASVDIKCRVLTLAAQEANRPMSLPVTIRRHRTWAEPTTALA